MSWKVKVIIADDNIHICKFIKRYLEKYEDIEILGVANTDEDEIKMIEELNIAKDTALNIKRLMEINCYRGQRHKRRLPVRGQRTKTNARTRKGKAKPIAGKKGV